ncbi:MAG: EVE domain-containing protein [Casimicrobiaceae bacterium]
MKSLGATVPPVPLRQPQYWIAVVAADHAQRARAGGYAELNHGRAGILTSMVAGDGFLTYSPRTSDPKGEPLQAFTSLGHVHDGTLYRSASSDGVPVFRVAVDYAVVTPAPIRPLLDRLDFIRNRQHWGAAFRFGALRIGAPDFGTIAIAMGHSDSREDHQAA